MSKKRQTIDYLGYDPAVIDAWFRVYEDRFSIESSTDSMISFFLELPQQYRRVVASMLVLARWILNTCIRGEMCPFCIVAEASCKQCPVTEVFRHITCRQIIDHGYPAKAASKIYAHEYRKAFGELPEKKGMA